MLRSIMDREYGHVVEDLDEKLHSRWVNLQYIPHLSIHPASSLRHHLTSIDLDTEHTSSLLLTAGYKYTDTSTYKTPTVSLYRKPDIHHHQQHQSLVTSPDSYFSSSSSSSSHSVVTHCVWYPTDTSLFLASLSRGLVSVWDTENFAIVCTTHVPKASRIACSRHHAARHDLVAVAPGPVLVDLRTGSAVHTLHSGVEDVVWSPAHPHLLAGAAGDGSVSLFDVRRAGCCVLTTDERARRMPRPTDMFPEATYTPRVQQGRRKRGLGETGRMKKKKNDDDDDGTRNEANIKDKEEQVFRAIGLGCAWKGIESNPGTASTSGVQMNGTVRRNSHEETDRVQRQVSIRFTPDGSGIVWRGCRERYVCYDVFTGYVTSTFTLPLPLSPSSPSPDTDEEVTFALTPDGVHVLSFAYGCATGVDIADGRLVSQSTAGPRAVDCVSDVYKQEIVTCSGSSIDTWSFPFQCSPSPSSR